jgi:hypothetical protein
MKILKNIMILLLLIVINNDSHADLPPPGNGTPPIYFGCVHQEILPIKKRNPTPPKSYLYAFIDIVEDCPPFIDDYAIPENEIIVDEDVIWGEPEAHEDAVCSVPLPDSCKVADINEGQANKAFCKNHIEQMCSNRIHGTGHDCRGGYIY